MARRFSVEAAPPFKDAALVVGEDLVDGEPTVGAGGGGGGDGTSPCCIRNLCLRDGVWAAAAAAADGDPSSCCFRRLVAGTLLDLADLGDVAVVGFPVGGGGGGGLPSFDF